MAKAIPFLAFTTPALHISLRLAPSIAEADAIVANAAKNDITKGTATFINQAANLPSRAPRKQKHFLF